MTISFKTVGETIFKVYLILACIWVVFALSLDIFGLYVHFTNPELESKMANEFSWKFDGTFKNNPDNIWYKGPKK